MAERRMFAKSIVTSDAFLDMPMSARCLYFTLGMFADDDGFVNNPKSIIRQIGASEDDMKVLLTKKFVIAFESGVIVIKHWRINNLLRSDRHHATNYTNELATLSTDANGAYTESGIPSDNQVTTNCQPSDNQRLTENSIGKVSIGKDSIKHIRNQIPPTLEMVQEYCFERKNNVDPQQFYDFYESKNWYVGKNKMKDWQASVRTWERSDKKVKTVNKTISDMRDIVDGMTPDEYMDLERTFNE